MKIKPEQVNKIWGAKAMTDVISHRLALRCADRHESYQGVRRG